MRRLVLAALVAGAASVAVGQDRQPAFSQTFELTGEAADAKGPMASKIIRVGAVDAQGNIFAIRGLATSNQGTDPQATTDAQGRFAVTVARSFFRKQANDSIALRVSTDIGGGRMSTAHEPAVLRFDSRKDKVDVGRVMFEPLKPRGAAR